MSRPKPNALKILEGNPGKRSLNPQEPKPARRRPRRPPGMPGRARTAWDAMAERLLPLGLLTEVDGIALEMLCTAYGNWKEAEARRHGSKSDDGELQLSHVGLRKSPWVVIADSEFAKLHKMVIEFGLTPAARSRVSTAAPKSSRSTDPIEEILAKNAR